MAEERKIMAEPSKLPFMNGVVTQAEYPLRIPSRPENPIRLDIDDLERVSRFKKLYGGCLCDALFINGIVNTVVSHDIKPLRGHDILAGRAIPVKWHSLAPEINLTKEQYDARQALWEKERTPQKKMHEAVKPGSVLVFDNGGDTQAAIFGEMSCTMARAHGCVGVVNNGFTRDCQYILKMENFPYYTRGTTPNAYGGWRVVAVNEPIYLPGHLTHYVIVNPGDFIFGDDDGLQIIPEPYVDSVLLKAEEILSFENEERRMIADGLPIEDVYKKFGDL